MPADRVSHAEAQGRPIVNGSAPGSSSTFRNSCCSVAPNRARHFGGLGTGGADRRAWWLARDHEERTQEDDDDLHRARVRPHSA